MIYYALCQSILTYCITTWGGAAKSHLIHLERAQRAVLKVSCSLPFFFSTTELYRKTEVLTVRQLFVLQTILKKHSQLPYTPVRITNKRRKDRVCMIPGFKTRLSQRFFCYLGAYLYNRASLAAEIHPLPTFQCKKKLISWLHTLTYTETEKLLTSLE